MLVVVLLCLSGLAFTEARLTVTSIPPAVYSENDPLTVTCNFDMDYTSKITNLQALVMSRMDGNQWRQIISVDFRNPVTLHVYEEHLDSSIGLLNCSGRSFLQAVFEGPGPRRSGQYKCEAYGLDTRLMPCLISDGYSIQCRNVPLVQRKPVMPILVDCCQAQLACMNLQLCFEKKQLETCLAKLDKAQGGSVKPRRNRNRKPPANMPRPMLPLPPRPNMPRPMLPLPPRPNMPRPIRPLPPPANMPRPIHPLPPPANMPRPRPPPMNPFPLPPIVPLPPPPIVPLPPPPIVPLPPPPIVPLPPPPIVPLPPPPIVPLPPPPIVPLPPPPIVPLPPPPIVPLPPPPVLMPPPPPIM